MDNMRIQGVIGLNIAKKMPKNKSIAYSGIH